MEDNALVKEIETRREIEIDSQILWQVAIARLSGGLDKSLGSALLSAAKDMAEIQLQPELRRPIATRDASPFKHPEVKVVEKGYLAMTIPAEDTPTFRLRVEWEK
jgi:hypothetical protein